MRQPEEIDDGSVWWFGESWGAPVCDDDYHVPTPVGQKCTYTGQTIRQKDRGFMVVSADTGERVAALYEPFIEHMTFEFGNTPLPMLYSDPDASLEDLINEQSLDWMADLFDEPA